MFGLEVVGAVAAAAALVELSSKCTKKLIQIKDARDDANARDFLKRVEQLAGTINDVFIVLSGIFGQPEKYQQFTDAEKIIWKRMEDILHLCKQHLEDLHQQLEVVAAKTEGFINRTKEAAKLSLLIPVIKRTKDDINLYFNALNLLKGLLQILATNRQYSQQQALHRDVLEIRDNHGDKLDEVLEGISQIREDIQRRSSHHAQSNTAYSNSHVRATGDKAEGLSAQLQEILIVAKASIGETAIHTPLSGMSSASQGSFLDSSSVSSLAETQSIMSKKMPPDSLPDVTHVEPLRELASRLQEQAASDFEHGHFKFAEYHQLESIKCHEELHDVHGIAFKSYHSMKMTLAEILLRQNKFMEAEAITVHADRGAGGLCYDSALGCKAVPSEALDNASSQGLAEVRDFKARLHLKMYQSGTSPASLDIAEKNARRAFQLRRDSSDTDNPKFKSIVDLLVRIYHMHPEKKMYAEIYRELYPTDQGRQGSIALSHHTTTTSASGPALNISSVIYSIKEHKNDDEQDVLHLIEESILHDVELNALVNGKSAMMVAVDCDDCARCDNIIDKLLRSGASGELPLQYAVRNLKSAKCTRLFEFNVDINCLDMHNMTPLMNAIKRDHKDMVSFLIENNADLNVSGPGGCTALHMAIKRWNAGIVRLLLDKKDRITLNSQDNEGWTALHYCAKFDKPLLAKKLYRDGADLEVEDNSDMKRTALWFAIDLQRYRITEILLELGAKINPSCMSLSTSNDIRNLLRTKRFGNG